MHAHAAFLIAQYVFEVVRSTQLAPKRPRGRAGVPAGLHGANSAEDQSKWTSKPCTAATVHSDGPLVAFRLVGSK